MVPTFCLILKLGSFSGYSASDCSSALIFLNSFRFDFYFAPAFFDYTLVDVQLHSGFMLTSSWRHYVIVRAAV